MTKLKQALSYTDLAAVAAMLYVAAAVVLSELSTTGTAARTTINFFAGLN